MRSLNGIKPALAWNQNLPKSASRVCKCPVEGCRGGEGGGVRGARSREHQPQHEQDGHPQEYLREELLLLVLCRSAGRWKFIYLFIDSYILLTLDLKLNLGDGKKRS